MSEHMDGVAIIGMAARMPNASDLDAFWQALLKGESLICPLTDSDLQAAGVPAALARHPSYVRVAADMDGIDMFDPSFFGMGQREAALIDPQQRILLELAHEAMEDAGVVPRETQQRVGVYVGSGYCNYLVSQLADLIDPADQLGGLQILMGNDKDYGATRISYKLNLSGPSMTVNTACSTSLVAVHEACRALQAYECDMALAGAVKINLPNKAGYLHQEGGISSRDGTCRPYDAEGTGPVFGSGAGMVLLKRLDAALEDRDRIYAVIRGSAVNNDGADKVSFSAPSSSGQMDVLADALADAGVSAKDIVYVEGHGTSTKMGDPIEVASLSEVYQADGVSEGACLLGTAKANVGHLEAAAGMAGLIKTVLSMQHGFIPPLANYRSPNPAIELARTPFRINTQPEAWPEDRRRLAGISAFGIGGTNAHLILEGVSQEAASLPSHSGPVILPVSADSPEALDELKRRYGTLLSQSNASIVDVAGTAATGRIHRRHRAVAIGADAQACVEQWMHAHDAPASERPCEVVLCETAWTDTTRDHVPSMVMRGVERQLQHIDKLLSKASVDPMGEGTLAKAWSCARTQLAVAQWLNAAKVPIGRIWTDRSGLPAACLLKGGLSLEEALQAVWVRLKMMPFSAMRARTLNLSSMDIVCLSTGQTWEDMASPACWQAETASPMESVHPLLLIDSPDRLFLGKPGRIPLALDQLAPALAQTVARAYAGGADIAWRQVFAGVPFRKVGLPTYPFQRVRCWIDAAKATKDRVPSVNESPIPTRQDTFESVRILVADFARLPLDRLQKTTRFQHELAMESMMLAELNAAISRRFKLMARPPLSLYFGEGSLAGLVDWLQAHADGQHSAAPDVSVVSNHLNDALADWVKSSGFPAVERMDKKWVHKTLDANVLVARVAPHAHGEFLAEVTQDTRHAYFYEHPQDHVPGLYLLEAARQAATAITHLHQGVPLGHKFILNDMSSNFDRMAELDAPILMHLQFQEVQGGTEGLERAKALIDFYQKDQKLGAMSANAVVFKPAAYQVLRNGAGVIAHEGSGR